MLFAAEFPTDAIQALQAVALAGIAAWVAIRTRSLERTEQKLEQRVTDERERCDGLEARLKTLEKPRKRRKPKRRPK